jgi:hypothetical protein
LNILSRAPRAVRGLASVAPSRAQLQELATLITQVGDPPAPPPRIPPTQFGSLQDGLAAAATAGEAEGIARGALATGARPQSVLSWATAHADDPAHADAAAAAVSGVIREAGYEPLFDWAADHRGDDAVTTLELPPELPPDLFAVPRRVYAVGRGIERRFARDYPYLHNVLQPQRPLGDPVLFRPEVVPAIAQEQQFMQAVGSASDDHYENAILPMSRIPGVNVLVLAALLLQEVLDPMEVLGWIGRDISDLPRAGTPNRPEKMKRLPAPGSPTTVRDEPAKVKYMIFSDTHREPPQDVEFRISHFNANQEIYLRALEWCDDRGYTVIENGDCEELWYVPSFKPGLRDPKLTRLQDILALHQPVYTKLADLAKEQRYYRSIGNHDSYLWEQRDLIDFRAANSFPELNGGFVIPQCKPMDDFLPHLGLNANDYTRKIDMLVTHGHQFDFWNCDEHNRLGKFITNAVGVPADAFDDVIYDFRGVDRLGHPLIEFWDVLAPLTPWSNWPPADVARQWAEALEYRPIGANLTQDSITYSETFAAVMGALMHSGPLSLDDPLALLDHLSPLLCIGHTHNPQSRPWIPYLERFNPWRDKEILGAPVFENLFALKTHYLNSGTVGWWEHIVWAMEITEEGQPRLIYWAEEDADPVVMDWELESQKPLPQEPFAGLLQWAQHYLDDDVAAGLDAAMDALMAQGTESNGAAATAAADPGAFWADEGPGPSTLFDAMTRPGGGIGALRPQLPLSAAAALSSLGAGDPGPRDQFSLAGLALAARQNPALRGADPRDWPLRIALSGRRPPAIPQSAVLTQFLWPELASGAAPGDGAPALNVASLVRGLFWSYTPKAPSWLAPGRTLG